LGVKTKGKFESACFTTAQKKTERSERGFNGRAGQAVQATVSLRAGTQFGGEAECIFMQTGTFGCEGRVLKESILVSEPVNKRILL